MNCLKVLDKVRYGGKTIQERKENADDNIYSLLLDRVIEFTKLEQGANGKEILSDKILPFYSLYILAICDMKEEFDKLC